MEAGQKETGSEGSPGNGQREESPPRSMHFSAEVKSPSHVHLIPCFYPAAEPDIFLVNFTHAHTYMTHAHPCPVPHHGVCVVRDPKPPVLNQGRKACPPQCQLLGLKHLTRPLCSVGGLMHIIYFPKHGVCCRMSLRHRLDGDVSVSSMHGVLMVIPSKKSTPTDFMFQSRNK